MLQAGEARFYVGKPLKVVVLRHERILLLGRELVAGRGERVVERLAGDLFEVFVLLHRGQPEGVLQLLLPPHLCDAQRLVRNVLLKTGPDPDRVDERAVQVEGECLETSHRRQLLLLVRQDSLGLRVRRASPSG